jgi:hypothetical protein
MEEGGDSIQVEDRIEDEERAGTVKMAKGGDSAGGKRKRQC